MICPGCNKEFNPTKYGRKEKMARRIALSGSKISLMGMVLENPFFNLLPKNAENLCNSCLREYMNLDSLELDWKTLSLKAKEESSNEENEF